MKVSRILDTLSKEEWHWLGKFVGSSAHNRHPEVVRLFEILKKNRGENTSPEAICQQLLGANGAAEKTRFHHLSNYLYQTLEDFLVWWELQKDGMVTDFNFYLMKSFQTRGLDEFFKANLDTLRARRAVSTIRNAAHHRAEYMLWYEDFQHFQRTKRAKEFDMQPLSASLDTHFISEKLRLACAIKSQQAVLSSEYDTGLLQYVLTYLSSSDTLYAEPAIAVYYFGYLMMTDDENALESYKKLRDVFLNKRDQFPDYEQREIILMLINFCIRKMYAGTEGFSAELLSWYKIGFDSKLFHQNGELSRFTYTNAGVAGIWASEYEWTEKFIEKYKNDLPEHQREGSYDYVKGRLFLEKKDYKNAQQHLLRAGHDDPLRNITVNILLLKAYFEDGDYGLLQNHFENFSAWLRRQKKLGYQKDNAVNIVKLARRLLSLAPSDASGREKLKTEVLAAKPLSEKDWFLNQIDKKR